MPWPLAKHLQQAGGGAARRGGELVLGDVDDPGALADRQAGQRHLVAGVEPALGARPARTERRHTGVATKIVREPDRPRPAISLVRSAYPQARDAGIPSGGRGVRAVSQFVVLTWRPTSGLYEAGERPEALARLDGAFPPFSIRPRHQSPKIDRITDPARRRYTRFCMSRRCELTGKGPLVGHKVSHSNARPSGGSCRTCSTSR